MNQPPSESNQAPTNVRFGVLGFACSLSMITYLDRVCFSDAAKHLGKELGLQSVSDMNLAFTAFAFSYAIFEIPSGWLGDVFGPRKTLIRIVLWWSLFTALTGMVSQSGFLFLSGLGLLILIRFLFGMGEAGAYPNITRALHNWFPVGERAFGQGAVWMAGRFMGGLTPLVWLLVVEQGGLQWRTAFYLFGVIGILWCLAFTLWFRNRPDEKPDVNEAERTLIAAGREPEAEHFRVPWGQLLTSVNLWALCLMYFCAAYGWYFNITYLPTFLEEQHGVTRDSMLGAIYKGGPLWMGAITCLIGGVLSDRFIRRTGNRKWGRRLFGMIGHGLCALCYLACLWTKESLVGFFLAISFAAFWNDLTMGAAWATCQDIGGRYAAIVAGCMNTVGNLGGAAAGWLTGEIIKHYRAEYIAAQGLSGMTLTEAAKVTAEWPGYQLNFVLFALVYVIAMLLWLRVDATRPVVTSAAGSAAEPGA